MQFTKEQLEYKNMYILGTKINTEHTFFIQYKPIPVSLDQKLNWKKKIEKLEAEGFDYYIIEIELPISVLNDVPF